MIAIRSFQTIVLILLWLVPGQVEAQLEPGWYDDQSIAVGDTTRYYRYYVPETLADPPPLVIYLHGGGSSMREVVSQNPSAAWPDVADTHGFILLLPNGTNAKTGDAFGDQQNWNDCRREAAAATSQADDVGFLRELTGWAVSELDTDPQRTYLSGSSNGGMMSFRMADEAPDSLAAIATFIANRPADSECRQGHRPLSTLIVVGTDDPLMPFDGGQVAGDRGPVLSADETREYWIERNGLQVAPVITPLPDIDPLDGSTIERQVYIDPRGGPVVGYLRMDGAGHSVPSRVFQLSPVIELFLGRQNHDIEGPEAAWQFFADRRRDEEIRFADSFEAEP